MTDQLLAELRKMRSTRTNVGLLVGMVALLLLTVLLNGLVPAADELRMDTRQYALLSAGTAGALFASMIGVMAITSEYRHGTIRSTFLLTPKRYRVVAAKVVASLLMGAAFGLVAIGLSFGIGYAILRARGIDFALTQNEVLLLVFGTPVMAAAWAVIGLGIGAILRNQVLAIIGLTVWAMVVENILRGLVPSVGKFTPTGASAAIVGDPSEHVLRAAAGAPLLLFYAAAIVLAGAWLVARRDVT